MNTDSDFRIFRIRLKHPDVADHSQRAWDKKQVGVWCGAWLPEELDKAVEKYDSDGIDAAVEYMTDRPAQKKLEWECDANMFHTCQLFRDIKEKRDWVFVCFEDKLCFGQLEGGIKTDNQHELNHNGDLFHFRKVINPKKFPLAELPDLARLVPQAGRRTVYTCNIYNSFLKILVKCQNTKEVTERFAVMGIGEWLDFLSDVEWESLCLGYLIIEYDYVPTGLRPGGTLKDLDIVGKTRSGRRIIGQCKKGPSRYDVTENFLTAYKNDKGKDKALYFWCSYGGVNESPDSNIEIVDRERIETWLLKTEKGTEYLKCMRKNP